MFSLFRIMCCKRLTKYEHNDNGVHGSSGTNRVSHVKRLDRRFYKWRISGPDDVNRSTMAPLRSFALAKLFIAGVLAFIAEIDSRDYTYMQSLLLTLLLFLLALIDLLLLWHSYLNTANFVISFLRIILMLSLLLSCS